MRAQGWKLPLLWMRVDLLLSTWSLVKRVAEPRFGENGGDDHTIHGASKEEARFSTSGPLCIMAWNYPQSLTEDVLALEG